MSFWDNISNWWGNIVDGINNVSNEIFQAIILFLPDSPFKDFAFPPEIEDFLGYLNYYVPFSTMVTIAFSWITCIGIFYGYQLILRFVQAIK